MAKRPGIFFRPEGTMPEEVELELWCPSGFESAAAFREQLSAALVDWRSRLPQSYLSREWGFWECAG